MSHTPMPSPSDRPDASRLPNVLRRVPLASRFITAVFRWQPPEEAIILSTAIVVGIATGFGAVAFIELLALIERLTAAARASLGSLPGLLVAMGLAGLVVGLMIERWAREAKGHGVPEVQEAVAIRGGRIRRRVAAAKVLASSITIGTGGSAGREGPIVQVGSALGSTVGQLLRFSNERVSTLVACGAAAGIAATFNAPIAGSIFALEVILGRFTARYFGAVVISSVAASVISRIFLSSAPAFVVPAYPLHHLAEIPIYVVLGVLAAILAVSFTRLLYFAEDRFDAIKLSLPVRAMLGMLATALVAQITPGEEVLGSGLHLIGDAIAANIDFSIGLLAALVVLKMVATSLTLGAGNSGGVFAPSLFMGAVLGGLVGEVAHLAWPDIAVNPGAYAIVGMAAVFSGAARAPITAILIVFEMSNDYQLILPLMLATVLATFLAEAFFRESIYSLKLRRKGVVLQAGRDVDVLQSVTVGEVMSRTPTTVPSTATLAELPQRFGEAHTHGLVVLDPQGRLDGIVTLSDLEQAIEQGMPPSTPVWKVGTSYDGVILAFADESLTEALTRMGMRSVGRLPVVDRADPRRVLGLIRRRDVIQAYNTAITQRADVQDRAKRAHLRDIDGTEFLDVKLEDGHVAVGKTVAEVARLMPQGALLVSIRRDGKVLIPRGATRFQIGDRVTAFAESDEAAQVRSCLVGGVVESVGSTA